MCVLNCVLVGLFGVCVITCHHMSVITCLLSHSVIPCLLSHACYHVCHHMSLITCLLSQVCHHMSVITCLLTYILQQYSEKGERNWGIFCVEMWRRVAGVRFCDVSKGHGSFVLTTWRLQKAFFLQTAVPNKTSMIPWNLPTLNPNEQRRVSSLPLCSLSYPQQRPFCIFNLTSRCVNLIALCVI